MATKPEETPPVGSTEQIKPEETITVTVLEKIFHSGTLYAEGSEITDTPAMLQSSLETEKVKIKESKDKK